MMELNWSIEVFVGFFVSSVIITAVILSYIKLRHIKIKSLSFIRLSFLFTALYFLFEAIADLFLNLFLAQLYNLSLPLTTLFFLFGVTYSKKESVYSISLIIICSLIPIFGILAFLPDSFEVLLVPGFNYQKILTKGYFDILIFIFYIISGILGFHWSFLIWRNTPFLYKKEASILFFTMIIIFPLAILSYLLTFLHPTFIIFSDITFTIGWYIMIYVFTKEPKLLYILPFIVYRIMVKDREGYPLFYHDWSESNIDENVFTGFINAVQLMSEEVIHLGGLLDFNLKEGIFIVYNSKDITVGLVASKSSTLLRDCVRNFTNDFEQQFEYLLKTSNKDMKQYETAYIFIDKYFSNFPYRIIPNKYHPLLVSSEYGKIPLEIDDKYYEIFKKEEIEQIKAELVRSPISSHNDFLELYKELKDEKDVDFEKVNQDNQKQ